MFTTVLTSPKQFSHLTVIQYIPQTHRVTCDVTFVQSITASVSLCMGVCLCLTDRLERELDACVQDICSCAPTNHKSVLGLLVCRNTVIRVTHADLTELQVRHESVREEESSQTDWAAPRHHQL